MKSIITKVDFFKKTKSILPTISLLLLSLMWVIPANLHGQGVTDSKENSKPIPPIPPSLVDWEGWSIWEKTKSLETPKVYSNPQDQIKFWSTNLKIDADKNNGAEFFLDVQVFSPSWVPLPGGRNWESSTQPEGGQREGWAKTSPESQGNSLWPTSVEALKKSSESNPSKASNPETLGVFESQGRPSIWLEKGSYTIQGILPWTQMPQKISIPKEIGILNLLVNSEPIDFPLWESNGDLWLQKSQSPEEKTGIDSLSINSYALLRDGIPMTYILRLELLVSGKSREAELGYLLPKGWRASKLESPIPTAMDSNGFTRVQIRPGKWVLTVEAMQVSDVRTLDYNKEAFPETRSLLIALESNPLLRVLEIGDAKPIDVSMTTFPEEWRQFPVYQWDLEIPLLLKEKLRGNDQKAVATTRLNRRLWLHNDGSGWTYNDSLQAQMQKNWRMNSSNLQNLGSVKIDGSGQLITKDPKDNSVGIEVRNQNINLDATGTIDKLKEYPASGWQMGVDQLQISMNLPPNHRLFAIFGVDWSQGDWLTSWSLLDIFIVLVLVIASYKVWGWKLGLLTLVTLLLSYKEPNAPQLLWLLIIIPAGILKVLGDKYQAKNLKPALWAGAILFITPTLPYLWIQIQQTIYPQLELVEPPESYRGGNRGVKAFEGPAAFAAAGGGALEGAGTPMPQAAMPEDYESISLTEPLGSDIAMSSLVRSGPSSSYAKSQASAVNKTRRINANMAYEAEAKIQTGPGIPQWTWRTINFGWNGPVSQDQKFHPIIVPPAINTTLSLARIASLLALFCLMTGMKIPRGIFKNRSEKTKTKDSKIATNYIAILGLVLFSLNPTKSYAAFPDEDLLNTLSSRILEEPSVPDRLAEIAQAEIEIQKNQITMIYEVHSFELSGIPLPGKFPAWIPWKVTKLEEYSISNNPSNHDQTLPLTRKDGYLWIALEKGVHKIRVEGKIPPASEWELSFLLKPKYVRINAPEWEISGISSESIPDQEVTFAKKEKKTQETSSSYDRQELNSVIQIERSIELGLEWQVKTRATRLTSNDKAITQKIPLLSGERVLSSDQIIANNEIEVRLPAGVSSIEWESELETKDALKLNSIKESQWVEVWSVNVSPIWSIKYDGIAPIFSEASGSDQTLQPVWYPWPGESVNLELSRPTPISGQTITISKADSQTILGSRQRETKLNISLDSSLGGDFPLGIPQDAEVTSLMLGGREIPVRKEGGKIIIPTNRGDQTILVNWKSQEELTSKTITPEISLPASASNITTKIEVPENRWILWATKGDSLTGPAIRYWVVIAFSILLALILGKIKNSPLTTIQWALLIIGLTQTNPVAAMVVALWLGLLKAREMPSYNTINCGLYNIGQIAILVLTVISLVTIVSAVAAGLLGGPNMFITGNGSSQSLLNWYTDKTPYNATALPRPEILSISIWWYRFAMLLWALWLALSLIGWLTKGYKAFANGPFIRNEGKNPPPIPQKEV